MALSRSPLACTLALGLMLIPHVSLSAEQDPGPVVQHERAKGKLKDAEGAVEVRRTRSLGFLPILDGPDSHQLYFAFDIIDEWHRYELPPRVEIRDDVITQLGAMYMYKIWTDERFVPFVWLMRLQDPRQSVAFSHADQLTFGFFGKTPIPDDWGIRAKTTSAYRIRQYPTHKSYIFYFGEEITFHPQWELLVATAGARLDWHTIDNTWRLYLGGEGDSRDFAAKWDDQRVWKMGDAITLYSGVRRHLGGVVYGSFEFGLQREAIQFSNKHSEDLVKYETKFNPWMKIGLETWIDKAPEPATRP